MAPVNGDEVLKCSFSRKQALPAVPSIRIHVPDPDKLLFRIYDAAGALTQEKQFSNSVGSLHEIPISVDKLKSGVYYGVVTAERTGQETVRKRFSFTVIK